MTKTTIQQIAKAVEAKVQKGRQRAAERRFVRPTGEREAHNPFEAAGAAKRAVAPIRKLFDDDKLTPSQYEALNYYRTQAQQAEDDQAESSALDPKRIMGGASGACSSGIPAKLLATPAIVETARIERDLGSLREIARFIAVEDRTLKQWCIERHGAREKYANGRFVGMVPKGEKRAMASALLELKFAAGKIRT